MKKIPTLFERVYINHNKVDILPNVTKGMEWVLNGDGRKVRSRNDRRAIFLLRLIKYAYERIL